MTMTIRAVRTPTLADIDRAARAVAQHLERTPVAAGMPELALKLEGLQPTGSFKVRGALAALSTVDADVPVVTASAGNHALGVAFAAHVLGRRATVVTSATASPVKVAAIRRFDVDLVQVGTRYDDAERHALELAARGAHFVSPYNDPDVIAGQATIGVELAEQLPGPLTVVCGVGGGGLSAGLGLWASTRPDVRVVGVEPAASAAMAAAVAAGHQVPIEVGATLADGAAGNIEPGSVTIDLVSRYVDELLTVTEDEIRDAIRFLATRCGVIAEGAAAAPVAAVLAGRVATRGRAVAVVSGRNIAPAVLAEIVTAAGTRSA
ncbi:threonine ammonia-lyase [Phytohabitans aurantiacus]|nr:pyridoxal-phosphate dependent enzyme [Phytohabitans aurantiacus]